MAVDLADYVEVLQREVTPLGATNPYASVDEDTWIGYLSDAFWEARLDGFVVSWEADETGLVTPTTGTDDIPRDKIALVVLYAGIRILRNTVLNTQTGFRAQAGPVEYEVQRSASMLTEMLRQLEAIKNRLITAVTEAGLASTDYLVDGYSMRRVSTEAYTGMLTDLLASVN